MNFRAKSSLLSLLIVISFCKCDSNSDPHPDTTVATNYLNAVLDIMQNNSINKDSINWTDFRAEVMSLAKDATTISGTYWAIGHAIEMLHDHHSFYVTVSGKTFASSGPACTANPSVDIVTEENIGYVRVPGFLGSATSSEATDLINKLQNKIKSQDNDSIKGWIVDLRGNTGGNMWPMLAGIGPILGNGVCSYFINPAGTYNKNSYQDGVALSDYAPICNASSPYKLLNAPRKTAVLIDAATASSGEAIAVSFIGASNTKLFGESATCGLSTANRSFTLSDGALLYICSSVDADRNFKKYGGPIQPDVLESEGQSAVARDAIDWILE